MAKRKVASSEEESEAHLTDEGSESPPVTKKKATKGTIKKPKYTSRPEISDSEDEEVPAAKQKAKKDKHEKKPKAAKEPSSSASAGPSDSVKIHVNKEGEKYIDLGKKKHATVRLFKSIPLVDIREFYGSEDDLKPGKKGISLTIEQWHTLRDSVGEIDKLIQGVKK
ncbi:PC4-domain-containing protein [Coprinopsis marcescibilis]|uniref:PC4-domain-containing protein n=1 Tax=Coprinopsis marcescibilis TaxID=230819 RepID=A0A5C3L2N7_COPMA|nr:PC4-domain-containing protein [Coprinopsis marcescibilis]